MTESIQSVSRALELLERLSEQNEGVSLTQLARGAGLQPPTAHRLLQTLVERQWVVQDPGTTRYRLSQKLLGIVGDLEATTSRLRVLARPHLEAVRDLSGESANLVLLDGLSAVYVDQAQSLRPIRMSTEIGTRVPAYASGAGKAMLAFAPHSAQRTLRRTPLLRITRQTITDFGVLRRELEKIRALAYATDDEEYELGVACTAAAIRGADGTARAAISVSAPAYIWRELDRAQLGQQLVEHAAKISARLQRTRVDT